MTTTSALDRILAKHYWAKQQVSDLEVFVDEFRGANRHVIRIDMDEHERVMHYIVEKVPAIPDRVCLLLGDAVHNLRSTLDYLAYALVAAGKRPNSKAAFPIFDKQEGFEVFADRNLPGVGPKCKELLHKHQPYKGGFGHDLWILHRLDIIDKHRLLLAICTRKVGRTMLPSEKEAYASKQTLIGPYTLAAMQYVSRAHDTALGPLNAGDILETSPISDEYKNLGFAFDVAINEPDVIVGRPLFLLLREISSQVYRVIENFAECL